MQERPLKFRAWNPSGLHTERFLYVLRSEVVGLRSAWSMGRDEYLVLVLRSGVELKLFQGPGLIAKVYDVIWPPEKDGDEDMTAVGSGRKRSVKGSTNLSWGV